MHRLLLCAVAGFAISTPAFACTLVVPETRTGESVDDARMRLSNEEQAGLWDRSNLIYLAEISQLRLMEEPFVETTFRPIAPIKGHLPDDLMVERGFPGRGCTKYMIGDFVVIYASEPGGPINGLEADAVLYLREIQDARIWEPLAARGDFEDLGFPAP